MQQLKAKEKQLIIKSPVQGVVLSLPAKPQQVVNPGTLLIKVGDPDKLEVKAEILSDDMAQIELGQKTLVTAPVLGESKLMGKVKKIYPHAEEKQSALGVIQRRVPVIISLDEVNNLKPGYEVRVFIEYMRKDNVMLIPQEAVRTTTEGQKEVMLVVEGRVQHRLIKTGISDGENIEVIEGLKVGNKIIRDGGLDRECKGKTYIKVVF